MTRNMTRPVGERPIAHMPQSIAHPGFPRAQRSSGVGILSILVPCALTGALLAILVSAIGAQSLIAAKAGSGTDLVLYELTGPPDSTCQYPTGPVIFSKDTSFNGVPPGLNACIPPLNIPSLSDPAGDVAVDMLTDHFWITDGMGIMEISARGLVRANFTIQPGDILPGVLTGLGYDSRGRILWCTDGVSVVGVTTPTPPGCAGAVLTVVVPAFTLPIAGIATDVEWDPFTSSLWVCDDTGMVYNLQIGGAPGPLGSFSVFGLTECSLSQNLQGLAVDMMSSVGTGRLYVTDGQQIFHFDAPGIAAPSTFAVPTACWPAPVGELKGLGFAARANAFGRGSDPPADHMIASIHGLGQTTSPSYIFSSVLQDGSYASTGFLLMSNGFLCPSVNLFATGPGDLGIPLFITPQPLVILWSGIIPATDHGRGLAIPTPIPTGVPLGATVYEQFWIINMDGTIQASNAMAVSISTY